MASEKVQSPAFRDYLVRLVRATGETLVNHADEIVGHKAGTTAFDILIHIPLLTETNDDARPKMEVYDTGPRSTGNVPIVETRQSYVSDEAMQILYADDGNE